MSKKIHVKKARTFLKVILDGRVIGKLQHGIWLQRVGSLKFPGLGNAPAYATATDEQVERWTEIAADELGEIPAHYLE